MTEPTAVRALASELNAASGNGDVALDRRRTAARLLAAIDADGYPQWRAAGETSAERWDRHQNALVAAGGIMMLLDNQVGRTALAHVEVVDGEPQLIVEFRFLKSPYRVTIEQLPDRERVSVADIPELREL